MFQISQDKNSDFFFPFHDVILFLFLKKTYIILVMKELAKAYLEPLG
jgi:hypothetical protein